ncbi:hypothetical protein ABEB36_005313 [Hypothenemus hampei]|uniref:Piezo-type mechanosensitive ion channel component n=1 Tax=Hypothenemus hampei TaxID=57062 RepID=A0ABD1F0C7_HYPHA
MRNYWFCAILFRIVLPTLIIFLAYLRPTVTSLIYLILGCYSPFFSVPSAKSMSGRTGTYLKIVIVISILIVSLLSSLYFVLYLFKDEHHFDLEPCTFLETTIRTIGIIEFQNLPLSTVFTWITPEPLMIISSIAMFCILKKMTIEPWEKADSKEISLIREVNHRKIIEISYNIGTYSVCFMLCLVAVLKSNIIGAVYFLVFLSVLNYWACNKSFGRNLARIIVCLIPIYMFNLIIWYIYQFQYFQEHNLLKTRSILTRLFALDPVKTYKDCSDPREFKVPYQSNTTLAAPISLYVLHHISVLVARQTFKAEDGILNLLSAFFICHIRGGNRKWMFALEHLKERNENEKVTMTVGTTKIDKIKMFLNQGVLFIFDISYLTSSVIMMIWAIAYVCWKGLIFLIVANLMWLIPSRKKILLIISPLLALYINFLLVTSYIYSLDLTPEEIPSKWGILDFRSEIVRLNLTWIDLFAKCLFAIVIFMAIRRLLQERAEEKQYKMFEINKRLSQKFIELYFKRFGKLCSQFLTYFWIWIVIIAMICLEFWTFSSIFRIMFVTLAVIFLTTFQLCPFRYWKKFIWIYWWIVIVYATINLFLLYMYQVEEFRKIMLLLLSEELCRDFGCWVWTDKTERFKALSYPIFLQIAVVIQYNYFQADFNKLISGLTPEEWAINGRNLTIYGPKWQQIFKILNAVKDTMFSILEIHLSNVILLIGWLMCVNEMCAVFVPLAIFCTVACVIKKKYSNRMIYVASCFVQIFVVCRLLYMNQSYNHSKWNFIGYYWRNGKQYNVTLNTADWLGFHESRHGKHEADFWQLSWCFGYVFIVTVHRIVTLRMRSYRKSRNLEMAEDIVLFPDVTYVNSHQSVANMLKFLVNYGFYKLGCEITMITASIVMEIRMDIIAITISCWLLIVFSLNRAWTKRVWFISLMLLELLIPIQYIFTLGLWPTFFYNSQTIFWNSSDFLLRLQQFCHLPNMAHPPVKEKISNDFILLLIMSRQWFGFKRETKGNSQYSSAGNNESVIHLIDEPDLNNPIPDFTTYVKTYLDASTMFLFRGWFYLSLIATFLAGTMRPSLYSFGFILLASVILWEGSDIFLRPPNKILFRWNCLVGYNIFVMMARTISQIIGCVLKYNDQIRFNCELLKIFTVGCVDKYELTTRIPNLSEVSSCQVEHDALEISWDCLCFFFLICQQRIFKSYYFIHIVNDTKAHKILANRGAQLIEIDRQKRKDVMESEQVIIKKNIEKKLERIRANRSKLKDIANGNYYHFEEVDRDIDIPLLPPKVEEEIEYESYDPMPLTEYFGLFISTDIDTVVKITTLRYERKQAARLKALGLSPIKHPKPGPSTEKDKDEESFTKTIVNVSRFIWGAFESFIASVISLMNRRTRLFRNILNEIHRDTVTLKEKTDYAAGVRVGLNKIWHPSDLHKSVLEEERKKPIKGLNFHYSIYMKLLIAMGHFLMCHSEWLCYLVIILYQTIRGNFISLPLVLMIFCWGSLTVPKPTKTFWVVIIALSLNLVMIKSFFGMGIAPWSLYDTNHNIFFPPTFIGLYNNRRLLNIYLLAALFFHRGVLCKLGLWEYTFYRTTELIADGDYYNKDATLLPVTMGTSSNGKTFNIQTSEVGLSDYFPKSIYHGLYKYAEALRLFILQLISPPVTQIPVDVYLPMFLCDIINFFILMFYYNTFQGETESIGLLDFVKLNRVPISFLISIILYMCLMLIDRAVYLKRNRFGKMVFHHFQVFFIHFFFFVIHPLMINAKFRDSLVLQIFYILKCIYFLFSAYQIRSGYPTLISYHYLWHGYTMVHSFGYKIYREIPYFLEIRCLFDWIMTDSCLGIPSWFKMEDVTQTLFCAKCSQEFDKSFYTPAGQQMDRINKILIGGGIYIFLILTVIFPFLLFSLTSTMGVATRPKRMEIMLYLGTAQPIFEGYVTNHLLLDLTEKEYRNMSVMFNNIPESEDMFENYDFEDVCVFRCSANSLNTWEISLGNRKELIQELEADENFVIKLELHYTHIGNGGIHHHQIFEQNTMIPPLPDPNRRKLIDVVKRKGDNSTIVRLPLVFPKFLAIDNDGKPQALNIMEKQEDHTISNEMHVISSNGDSGGVGDSHFHQDSTRLRNLLISLHSVKNRIWWKMQEECRNDDNNYKYYLKTLKYNSCDQLVIYLFNEKVFPGYLQLITRGGILGLYFIYFMVVIKVIRSCRADISDIWKEDLPSTNKVLRRCMEIYVARDMKNFELEQAIFNDIICIMRSREMFIKLTRMEDNNYNPNFIVPETSKK